MKTDSAAPEPTLDGDALTRRAVLQLHPGDNVAVALRALVRGDRLSPTAQVLTDIEAGHKVALDPIRAGERVCKYGQSIGVATQDIAPGEHVHVHNLGLGQPTSRSGTQPSEPWRAPLIEPGRQFAGFLRPDGRVGTRNFLAVVTSVNCSATVARRIVRIVQDRLGDFPNVDGAVAVTHGGGCAIASSGEGIDVLRRTLAGYARHPNVAGVLMLGLGCETNQLPALLQTERLEVGAPLAAMTIQAEGGTAVTIETGVRRLLAMAEEANRAHRVPLPLAGITVGLQCGGSDGYSGITANPALGYAADLLAAHGGTAILSETPEIYGAEHLLTSRAANPAVSQRLMDRIAWWERHVAATGGSMDNNPSAGNKAGGLTTILEKSLGAVAKSGSSPLRAVYEYAQTVTEHGLVFMDTPGYDPVSATGQIAGGANLICFTTGRGSVFGSKPVPSLKLSTNSDLYRRMPGDIDIDCGQILEAGVSIESMGRQIFELIVATASGLKSKSELLDIGDEEIQPWRLGATM